MKYISTLILILLLAWSWAVTHCERPLRLEQYKRIEGGVEDDIRNFVMQRYPSTTDLYCPQLYTEIVSPGAEMIAHFRCQVTGATGTDDASEQIFEGFLRLKSDDGFETWSSAGGEISAKEIRFLKGIQVTPGDHDESGTK
jgi:hypothetical protein